MKFKFNLRKSGLILSVIILILGAGFWLSNASVIGINPRRIQAWINGNQVKVTLNLWNNSTEIQPAKIYYDLYNQEGYPIYKGVQSLSLKPGKSLYYDFIIPTRIESDKLFNYTLKYTVSTPGGIQSSGYKNLFEIVPQLETVLVGQREFYAGSTASIRLVAINHATGDPVPNAEVSFQLQPNTSGSVLSNHKSRILYQGKTDSRGIAQARIYIPEDTKTTSGKLNITVQSSIGEDKMEENIVIKRAYKILLSTDKPLYQPGQTIHLRSLALGLPDLKPLQNKPILLEISDSKGNKIFKEEINTDMFGIIGSEFKLADEINLGLYGIKVTLGETVSEKKVTVDRYVLPKFKLVLKTDKQYYSPGETIHGEILSDYFFGKPVSDGKFDILASKFEIQFEEFSHLQGRLDKTGHYKFELKLPDYFAGVPLDQGKAQVKLDFSIIDNADHKQEKTLMIPITKDPIQINLIPEAGSLKPNLDNILYILTNYPDGSPAPCDITGLPKNLKTDSTGIGIYKVKVENDNLKLHLTARDKQGNMAQKDFNLSPEVGEESVLIRTDKAIYQSGNTLNLSAFTHQKQGTFFVDLIKEGQTYLTKSSDITNGQAQFEIDLDETLTGTILINGYIISKTGNIIRDSRWVFVNPASELKIKVDPNKTTYRPGDDASIKFNVTDTKDQSVYSALGISIVDEAVFALQDMQPGLEKVYFMLEKEILEPRYEIHGYDIKDIIIKPDRVGDIEERDFQKQQAAKILLVPKPGTGSGNIVVNTYQQKNQEYKNAIQQRMQKAYEKIIKAINSFYNRFQKYPDKKDGIKQLIRDRFISEMDLIDPWGNPYEITVPEWTTVMNNINLKSKGPDGLINTSDDINQFDWMVKNKQEGRLFLKGGMAINQAMVEEKIMMAMPAAAAMDKKDFSTVSRDASSKPAEEPRLRMYFPETLYFNPALLTNSQGKAVLKTKMADSITSWRLTAIGSDMKGRLGSVTAPLRVFQDFFIDIDLPVSLTQNDQVSIPIAVYNYLPQPQKIKLVIETGDWFELKDEITKEIELKKDEVRAVYYTIKVKKIGYHALKVTAYGDKMSDAIQRSIEVMPDGKETLVSFSDRLIGTITKTLQIPLDAIDDASKILVKIYPGIFSQVVEGLDSMFRMPFGCFEQTSSVTYPNILVLKYLMDTKQVTPEIQMKAKEYINLGYQRLLSYEVQGGGFEWFGNAPANQILTAWGVMEFSDMSKVHTVDPDVISRTQKWLLNKQNADGSWNPDASYLHAESWSNIQNSKVLVTAYITWALAETGLKDNKLNQAMTFLRNNYKDIDDPYTLAIIANAIASFNPEDPLLTQIFNKIMTIKKEDKDKTWWESKASTVTYSHGNGANIEATALIAIALMNSGKESATVSRIMNYLISMKDPNGNWGSTQGTILTLKAMLLSLKNLTDKVNATIQVKINGKEIQTIKVTSKDSDVMRQLDLKEYTQKGNNQVELVLNGDGSLLYQIVGKYYLPWKPVEERQKPLSISVDYDKTELTKNDIVKAKVIVKNNRSKTANMLIVDLGIPPGFDVITNDLDEMVKNKLFQKYSMTGRQIIIYLEKIGPNQSINFEYSLKAKYPIKAKTPSSQVYEYYNPEVKQIATPVVINVK